MKSIETRKSELETRRAQLSERMAQVESELESHEEKDWDDAAIEHESDEVLELILCSGGSGRCDRYGDERVSRSCICTSKGGECTFSHSPQKGC